MIIHFVQASPAALLSWPGGLGSTSTALLSQPLGYQGRFWDRPAICCGFFADTTRPSLSTSSAAHQKARPTGMSLDLSLVIAVVCGEDSCMTIIVSGPA